MSPAPIVVKRYARSRLYDTVHLRYISLEDLRRWAKSSIAFQVINTETGADITEVLLA